jgi:hypothetical protein
MEQNKLPGLLVFIVPQIVELIIQEYGYNDEKATEMLYESELYASLEKEETKLWHLSPHALFEMYKEERQTGHISYPEEA